MAGPLVAEEGAAVALTIPGRQLPSSIEAIQHFTGVAFDCRKAGILDSLRVFGAAVSCLEDDPMDHLPFYTVFRTLQVAGAISPVDQRPLEISGKPQPAIGRDQDGARGARKALGHKSRIIALDDPLLTKNDGIMKCGEFRLRPLLPVRIGKVMKLIQMDGRKAQLPGQCHCKC